MSAPRTLQSLMAQVGFLLLYWGRWESILRAGEERDSAFDKADLNRAERELANVRDLRNLVAHGMRNANADPDVVSEPTLFCVDVEGARQVVVQGDLEAAIDMLEKVIGEFPVTRGD